MSTVPFPDVPTQHWAHDYIYGLAKLRIISGFPDGSFRPDAPVTRAQFAAILRNAFPADVDLRSVKPFSDVAPSYWANTAIRTTRATGFLSGYPGNRFRPEQKIPRVQALVALANGLNYPIHRLTATADRELLNYYQDADQIPNYAIASLAAATDLSLVVNYPHLRQLNPNRNASRAEIAAFVYQALYQEAKAPPIPFNPYRVVATSQPWQTQPRIIINLRAAQLSLNGPGTRLATLNAVTNLLQVWDTETGALLRSLKAPSGATFEAIALSEDGDLAIALHQNRSTQAITLQAWSVATGQSLWQQPFTLQSEPLSIPSQPSQVLVLGLAIRPRHDQLLTQASLAPSLSAPASHTQLQLHQLETGAVSQTLTTTPNVELFQFAFSFQGDYLAALGSAHNGQNSGNDQLSNNQPSHPQIIHLWQLSNGKRLSDLPLNSNLSLNTLTFTPNGSLHTLGQTLSQIQLDTWDIRNGQRLDHITQRSGIDSPAFLGRLSPDGVWYLQQSDVTGANLINTQLGSVIALDSAATPMTFSGKGEICALADQANVKVFAQAMLQ